MLELKDNDDGIARVVDGQRLVFTAGYDTRDRKSQKSAHREARAFIAGADLVMAQMGLNSAGVPVYEGRVRG